MQGSPPVGGNSSGASPAIVAACLLMRWPRRHHWRPAVQGVERKRWQQCLRVLGLLGQLEVELRAVPVFIGQVQVSG